ncbi:MAG: hypothetical protein ACREB9_00170 [Thermoplasmata archaeon]
MSTREVAQAIAEIAGLEAQFGRATGIYKARMRSLRMRLDQALAQQNSLKEELERAEHAERTAYQQNLYGSTMGGAQTFLGERPRAAELRVRIAELGRRLSEAP